MQSRLPIVEARLVSGNQTVATATAQVNVTYRESWIMDRLGVLALPLGSVGDLFVTGRHALVARRGFHGFSVVNVDAIQEVGRFDPAAGAANDVHVVGNRAYVTHESFTPGSFRHGVTIVDITNPVAPVELGGIPFELSGAHTVFVDGTTAYLANSSTRQIVIWDVANPAAPVRLAEVAEQVGLSTTPCWRRIQALQEAGVIRKRVALLDAAKVGAGVTVFVMVRTSRHDSDWLERFAGGAAAIPEVVEFYRMSGVTDYLLKVQIPSITAPTLRWNSRTAPAVCGRKMPSPRPASPWHCPPTA